MTGGLECVNAQYHILALDTVFFVFLFLFLRMHREVHLETSHRLRRNDAVVLKADIEVDVKSITARAV